MKQGLAKKYIPRWKLEEILTFAGQGSKVLFLKIKAPFCSCILRNVCDT
jgi:hypothetical protein